jgi:hypothetical protein
MGLIESPSAAAAAAEYIKAEIKGAASHLQGSALSAFARFWNDSGGATPQEILDAFGTNAATLVQVFAASKDLLNLIKPGTINATGPYSITQNQDGTATVVIG